jgi:hypothetical protein
MLMISWSREHSRRWVVRGGHVACRVVRRAVRRNEFLHIVLGWAKEVKPGRREPDANHLKEPSSPITTSTAYTLQPSLDALG